MGSIKINNDIIKNKKKYIKDSANMDSLYYSKHAIERMGERMIDVEVVSKCAKEGQPIETQFHGRDIKILFQEPKKENPEIYSIIAAATPPLVVSVCYFKEELWEDVDGIKKRRKSHE